MTGIKQSYIVTALAPIQMELSARDQAEAVVEVDGYIRDLFEDTDLNLSGGLQNIEVELNVNEDEDDR